MKKDNVLETKYLERPRGEGKGWVFRMPTPRLLVGWINANTGRPYGKTIREGLRAFPGEIYAAPAHSPAQPPQGYRPYRVVGRGSGWFDFFRKCSSTRAVAVARKRRDLRLGEIRAEEGKLEAEKAGDIELAAKNHDALRRVRHPAVKQAMQEDIEKYARDKVLPVAGMAKAKLWRNVARDGHVPLSLIYETYLEDAGKDLARTTVPRSDPLGKRSMETSRISEGKIREAVSLGTTRRFTPVQGPVYLHEKVFLEVIAMGQPHRNNAEANPREADRF